LRSKQEYDRSGGGKGKGSKPKRDVTNDNSSDEYEVAATSSTESYVPPWFDRYAEYKFNLLDRAGQAC